MNERVSRLRQESYDAPVTLSTERAELITDFHIENNGKFSIPVMRAKAFEHLCRHKTIQIGDDELIVGERGPRPKAVPTYPELTCHSEEDLGILNSRPNTRYGTTAEDIAVYREKIIPFWRGRTMRDRIFDGLSEEWKTAYEAGIFTEFMEQRAPGHTTLDGKFYTKGLLDFKRDIEERITRLDFAADPEATAKREQLRGMSIACDAVILFAERHAELADRMAAKESKPERQEELERIASICRRVPAHAPRDFWEALQMYWFMHLGTITELNGWDAMNPGHLDRYFFPFYKRDLNDGTLTRESAKELLECFWIKFNNHPAPPKVGVTAKESGTYNDFTNINLGGILPDGADGVNELTYLMLEVMDEIHLLQPQGNIQLSRKNEDRFLKAACRVIRKGYGYPSVFNADGVVEQMVRCGKRIEDAREGGTSGCVETGAFGKEAYILTGYLNTPKILEITLNNGIDPRTGKKIGIETGDPRDCESFDELFEAFRRQLLHFVDIKIEGNQFIERMYATYSPAVFLSVLIDDCIENGKDYNDGGPRYNTNYIQCVGIGTITDSFSAIRKHVFDDKTLSMSDLLDALTADFRNAETLRLKLVNKTPRYGNDDDYADKIMMRVFDALHTAIDGRPNTKGGEYHIDMLPTTCHIYFGSVLGASADGRNAWSPVSEGISPVQGADRKGPTAVIKSVAKMDHLRTGGTLLNMKFMPSVLDDNEGIEKLAQLVRTYFRLDGHHMQFNVVDADTLRRAQEHPEDHRDLIVRVAGYSDYFCDIGRELQDEIIRRTEHQAF
ncbi:MAG: glycyl radical protein [Candidatus Latescibacterota bacterium]|nr:MAG: glycyl radical protein [Candidatus Latescibacterota bacterium]